MIKTFVVLFASTLLGSASVELGIDVLESQHFAPLAGKRVGLVTNQTGADSAGRKTRIILHDAKSVNLVALYSPEHGIDGTVAAGKYVATRKDPATGLTVYSLYGPTRKPTAEMLKGIDVLIYDMQDIGVRSYTYISTMVKCMEAADECGTEFLVLDRPNPLGGKRVEGPGIEEQWRSFVGQLPIPYVHGMTAGELARMAKAKGWAGPKCKLNVIAMRGWNRSMLWPDTGLEWIQTSPNIPTVASAFGYAATSMIGSLDGCGLDIGIGVAPFQRLGHSQLKANEFAQQLSHHDLKGVTFTPYTSANFQGANIQLDPKAAANLAAINVYLLAEVYGSIRPTLFNRYHDPDNIFWKIYGSQTIRAQLENGTSAERIIAGWQDVDAAFRLEREPYLLY
jgi:uncharacterized protein YbbC (DUF1343 family)